MLGVARSGYYAWAPPGVSARTGADEEWAAQIARSHETSRRTYGAPRIHAALQAEGVRCGSRQVARLMGTPGLVGCHQRRRTRTTVADPAEASAPTSSRVTAPP